MVSAMSSIPANGLSLHGWPAQPYRPSQPGSSVERAAILLKVNDRVIRDLQECARQGKAVKLLTGKVPKLQYGSKGLDLSVETERFTHELYSTSPSSDELVYAATVTQRATLVVAPPAPQGTVGTDNALAALKQSLASFAQEKEAKQATISSAVIPSNKTNKILSNRYVSRDSAPASPLPNHAGQHLAPTSTPQTDRDALAKSKAMAYAISHLLSSGPRSDSDIQRLTMIPLSKQTEILGKIAEVKPDSKKWVLKDKAYKDLEVWKFPFQKEGREAAIEHAVRAFDRLRLAKDDKLWQMLLPESERGKGKCLSRLHNAAHFAPNKDRRSPLGHASPGDVSEVEDRPKDGRLTPFAAASTPMARSSSGTGKSTTIDKRLKDSQKQRAVEEARLAKQKAKEAKGNITNNDTTTSKPTPTSKKYKSEEIVKDSDDEPDGIMRISKAKPSKPSPQKKDVGTRSPAGTPSSEGRTLQRTTSGVGKKVASHEATTPLHQSGGPGVGTPKTTPAQRVEKQNQRQANASPRPGADTSEIEAKPEVKPKNASPLVRVAASSPSMFGGLNATPSVVKKTSPVKAQKVKTTMASGTETAAKRPASRSSGDSERPQKIAKTNDQALPRAKAAQQTLANQERSLKRKTNDLSERETYSTKHRRSESSSTQSLAMSSSSGNSLTTTAQTSVPSPSPPTQDSWLAARSPSVASSGSERAKLGWERALDDAEKFRTMYYPAYQKLYDRIKTMKPHDVTREDTVKLWRMHDRLKEMKKEISNAAQD